MKKKLELQHLLFGSRIAGTISRLDVWQASLLVLLPIDSDVGSTCQFQTWSRRLPSHNPHPDVSAKECIWAIASPTVWSQAFSTMVRASSLRGMASLEAIPGPGASM